MKIRRAKENDIIDINRLLIQVNNVHYNKRPDLFKCNSKKYTDIELKEIINNDNTPVFVIENKESYIVGYAFCKFEKYVNNNIFNDIQTLYIDDLCVDENLRGQNIGSILYNKVVEFAKANNCYNITLNVWCDNEFAKRFYEKCGLKPQKIGMEKIL